MSRCQYYDTCGLDADVNSSAGLCILHSTEPSKDKTTFGSALEDHRKKKGDNFDLVVFPGPVSFSNVVFENDVTFRGTRFLQRADFEKTEFRKNTSFRGAIFSELAYFYEAKFLNAEFFAAKFLGNANFDGATFQGDATFYIIQSAEAAAEELKAHVSRRSIFTFMFVTVGGKADFRWRVFGNAVFQNSIFGKRAEFEDVKFWRADFSHATFEGGANFIGAEFIIGGAAGYKIAANFERALFFGPTIFSPKPGTDASQIFRDVEVDFRAVMIRPLDALVLRDADLRKCQFYNTDLRDAEISAVTWPTIGRRLAVYDEIVEDIESPKRRERERFRYKLKLIDVGYNDSGAEDSAAQIDSRPLFGIERLYRQLKQNCERRGDYERAGDFHFGEKEMRRRNPKTSGVLRFFLTAYWLLSGYGERYLRPLIWAALILIVCTFLYLLLGVQAGTNPLLVPTNAVDWFRAAHYSLRVMLLLKPDDLPPSETARVLNTALSIAGPLLFGLFALAFRQRLKR